MIFQQPKNVAGGGGGRKGERKAKLIACNRAAATFTDGIWPEMNLSPYLFTLRDNPGINRGIWGIRKYFAASSESLL